MFNHPRLYDGDLSLSLNSVHFLDVMKEILHSLSRKITPRIVHFDTRLGTPHVTYRVNLTRRMPHNERSHMFMSRAQKVRIGFIIYAIVAALTLMANVAKAAPSYVETLPKDKISAREALKQARAGTTVFKCQRATVTESGGIGKAKGAKTVFYVGIKHDDAAQDKIMDGGKGYKCQGLQWDDEKRKLSNAQDADIE